MTVLYRHGGMVLVRLGAGPAARQPFKACLDVFRAPDLAACVLRVPVKQGAAIDIDTGPDQAKLGSAWISATVGRVDVPSEPHAVRRQIGWACHPVFAVFRELDNLAIAAWPLTQFEG